MRRLFSILAFLPLFSFGAIRGWFCRIELSCYRSTISGYNSSTGQPMFNGAYTGAKKYVWKYSAGSGVPTLGSFGLTQYNDLDNNPCPPAPYHSEFDFWAVTRLNSWSVDDSRFPDSSDLGIPFYDQPVNWYTPIYDSSGGNPFTFEGASISGVNNSFGSNGSLDILQGQISNGDNMGTVPQYLYYGQDGAPVFSLENNGGYEYLYNPSTGKYDLQAVSGGSNNGGSVDLSPVVNELQTQGGLTRSQLVDLLGSSGNSWVYDCKLSLSQLNALAAQYYPNLSDINSSILGTSDDQKTHNSILAGSIVDAIEGIEVSPNITVNPAQVNIDTSSLATETTLGNLYNYVKGTLGTHVGNIKIFNQNINSLLTSVKNTLTSWDNTTAPSISAPSGFDVTDDNEGLPDGLRSLWASDSPLSVANTSQRLGDYVSWGTSGAPQVFNLDFLSGFLTTIIGSIPSVGSDDSMFSLDLDLPYLGRIQREYRWTDFPYIGEFRTFLVWVLYVFFGIACFKLLHKTLI